MNTKQLKKSKSTTPIQQKSAFFSPSGEGNFFSSSPVQRKSVVQNKKEPLQRKEEGVEQESSVQMKGKMYAGSAGSTENNDSNVVQGKMSSGPLIPKQFKKDTSEAGGKPKMGSSGMPENVQTGMEKLFQTSFAGIKIHQDSAKASRMGALAYTQGKDVHFAPGQYNPGTKDGRTLIGHELRHVQQQSAGQVKPTTEIGGMPVNDDKHLEADADRWGAMAGQMKMDGAKSALSKFKPQSMPFNTGAGLAQAKMKSLGNASSNTIQAKMAGGGGGKGINVDASQQYLNQLTSNQPSEFVKEMSTAGAKMSNILSGEKQSVKQSLPEIEQPTGIEAKKGGGKKGGGPVAGRGRRPGGKGGGAAPRGRGRSRGGGSGGGFMGRLRGGGKGALGGGPSGNKTARVGDQTVNIGAGTPPKVDLSGQADPSQMEQQKTTNISHVERDVVSFNQQAEQDHGEKDVYPDVGELKLMKPEVGAGGLAGIVSGGVGPLPPVEPDILGGFNAEAQAYMSEKVMGEMAKNDATVAEMNASAEAEWTNYEEQLKSETESVAQQQRAAKQQVEQQVSQHKQAWKQENEQMKQQFANQANQQQAQMKGQIDAKVQSANQQATSELRNAEAQAQSEANRAQAEAKAKEQEAERKKAEAQKESGGGFFGKVKNKVKGAVNKVKNAVKGALNWLKSQFTKIVNKLKNLVKTIIEKAKQLASQLIEKARAFIVGLIQKFGNYLKQLADKYLAKFPALRDKFKSLIDKAVQVATDKVNQLAKQLEQFVHKLLDRLGSKLMALIDRYASYISGIFAVLDALAKKLFEVLDGLSNLAKAAKNSPGQFVGQISEEVLGTDVTQPLPNERPLPETATPEQISKAAALSGLPPEDVAFLQKDSYADGDFQVDQIMDTGQLPPGLMDMIAKLGEGEHEFPGNDSPENSLEALKAEMLGMDPAAAQGALESQGGAEGGAAPAQQTAGPEATAGGGDGLVGPFKSPAERAAYLVKEMGKKAAEWVNQHKGAIIAGIVGGLAGFLVLNILSGGAVMAALPLIMQIFSSVMLAKDIATITGFVGNYLTSSWPGDIMGGAKNLARAFAIAAVEVATTLLFGPGEALGNAKKVAKTASEGGAKGVMKMGVNAASDGVKGTAKAAKDLAKVGKEGAQTTLKNGKAIMKGLKNGEINAKSMKELGQAMGKQMRFKKFKVTIKGLKFKLMGKINPWVELASGDLKEVDEGALKTAKGGKAAIGDAVKYTDEAGNVIDAKVIDITKLGSGGELVQALPGTLKKSHDELIDSGLKVMEEGNVIKYFDESGRLLAEVSDGTMKFKYKGFGGDVVMDPDRPTTVLGKFVQDWQNPSRNAGTIHFLGSAEPKIEGFPDGSFTRGAGKNAEAGRMNILDIPEPQYNDLINQGIKAELAKHVDEPIDLTTETVGQAKEMIKKKFPNLTDDQMKEIMDKGLEQGNENFWTHCNRPFLEDAFKRGDNIRLISDPKTFGTGFYGRELATINGTLAPKYGYVYNPIMNAFIKAK